MRLPILYALTYPERIGSDLRFPVQELRTLDFSPPDIEKFPCLRLAYEAAEAGGTKTIALNAADEVAVAAFLQGKVRFPDIPRIIESTVSETVASHPESISQVLKADAEARRLACDKIEVLSRTPRSAQVS
jgi:1-deoxy-D-xylulose-5-phosphate reductoisomerase